jgi:spore coat polysaccharide biosynthesis predicted glycosyltransferase SpsG
MKIAFKCNGKITYRCKLLGYELKKRGHKLVEDQGQLLIVDHELPQHQTLAECKSAGIKTVLLDGSEEEVESADLSISPLQNSKAQHTGYAFIVVPPIRGLRNYSPRTKSRTIYVSVGETDRYSYAQIAINAAEELGLKALVVKSDNHKNLAQFKHVGTFAENDYYSAMSECIIAVTNGGLSMFQCLHYGIPTIPLPQNDKQKRNINFMDVCCVPSPANEIAQQIRWLVDGENYRESLSVLSQHFVSGTGINKTCDLIERQFGAGCLT